MQGEAVMNPLWWLLEVFCWCHCWYTFISIIVHCLLSSHCHSRHRWWIVRKDTDCCRIGAPKFIPIFSWLQPDCWVVEQEISLNKSTLLQLVIGDIYCTQNLGSCTQRKPGWKSNQVVGWKMSHSLPKAHLEGTGHETTKAMGWYELEQWFRQGVLLGSIRLQRRFYG